MGMEYTKGPQETGLKKTGNADYAEIRRLAIRHHVCDNLRFKMCKLELIKVL